VKFKVGDIICRKDMPSIRYQIIVGTSTASEFHNMWVVKLVSSRMGMGKTTGMIAKDDDRWEVVK